MRPLSLAAALLLASACSPTPPEQNEAAVAINPAASPDASPTAPAGTAAPVPVPVPADPGLAVEAEGLRLFNPQNGAARPLPFGIARADVMTALAFRGPPGTGTNGECGAGPLDYASWPDGLTLYFQAGKFTGWAADNRGAGAIATASGIGPGSTRAALEDAYAATFSQTSIGTEFAAGDLYGVFEGAGPQAKITNMWAGVSCIFR